MTESDIRSKNSERENRILDVTAALIVRYGYDKTSVNDIAKGAGISKGAIYLHFDSKDDLIYRLILREMLKLTENWIERFQADTSSQIFASMYKHVLWTMQENAFIWSLYSNHRQLLGVGFFNRQDREIYQQRLGLSQTLLTQLQAVGAIRANLNPETTAYMFNMLNYGYLKLGEVIPEQSAPPNEDIINEIGELVQRHLEPDGIGNSQAARQIIIDLAHDGIQLLKSMQVNQDTKL